MFELKSVSKKFGTDTALEPTSLSFAAQRTYVLLGTSGCGKSTLLKLMLGLHRPSTGTVFYGGKPLKPDSVNELRRQVGYVIQDGGLFPHLSAAENVALVSRYLRWDQKRIDTRLRELADLVQLPFESLNRPPSQLSGGQQQRVGLMRALMLDPSVLLLDEPLGALDPIIRSELQADLRRIFSDLKKTVIMVTHDLHEAAYFADEIVLLDQGRVVQRGTIDELVQSPASEYVTKFISAQRQTLPEVAS
jgi:osmoprotectant transport system ATP-binding protein